MIDRLGQLYPDPPDIVDPPPSPSDGRYPIEPEWCRLEKVWRAGDSDSRFPGVLLIEPMFSAIHADYFSKRIMRGAIPRPESLDHSCRITIPAPLTDIAGLHYQEPHAQGKLVMVAEGEVYDVVVDIRKGLADIRSMVRGRALSENRQLYVPPGCAHGFCVTSDRRPSSTSAQIIIRPNDERGIIWNDPVLAFPGRSATPILSPKDQAYKHLRPRWSGVATYRPD